MKNSFWIIPLIALAAIPAMGAGQGKTTVELEMHSSSAPLSPAASIRGSSIAVVSPVVSSSTAAPSNADKVSKYLNDLAGPNPHARLLAAASLHELSPSTPVPPKILTRLVHIARAPADRERTRSGWITTCDAQIDALDTLGALGSQARPVIPDLVRLTHRLCIYEHVVAALQKIGEPDAEQMAAISSGLSDRDPEARQAAIEYLAKTRVTPETIITLGRAMNDPQSGVRLSALQALEEIHPEGEGRLPLLAGFMKDPSADIRQRALFMVGQLGPEAKAAVPILHEALKDPEPLIALSSAKILAKMDPEDDRLITTLIAFSKDTASATGMQAAKLLESLNVHDARIDAALEPYRTQQALWNRISKAMSDTSPEQLAENARTLKIEKLRVAAKLVKEMPVHVAKSFPAGIGRIYCWTEVSISSPPASVIHRWYRNGKLQREVYLDVLSRTDHLWSSAAVRAGEWKVEITPAGAKEPIATALFKVTKKAP